MCATWQVSIDGSYDCYADHSCLGKHSRGRGIRKLQGNWNYCPSWGDGKELKKKGIFRRCSLDKGRERIMDFILDAEEIMVEETYSPICINLNHVDG
jgi:hypothetical protein